MIDSKIKIYLYARSTDMRKGMQGLAMMAEANGFKGKSGGRYYSGMDKDFAYTTTVWIKVNLHG